MKANQMVNPVIAEDFSAVTFEVRGHAALTLDMTKIHPNLIRRAACVGFAQVRIVDAAAIARADKAGNVRSEAEMIALKYERMSALIAHYETGTAEWSRVSESAGPRGGYLFEALCRMYAVSKTPEQIRAYLDGLTDKEQAALREDDEVAPVIAEIKKEKTKDQPKMDTKALMAGLK